VHTFSEVLTSQLRADAGRPLVTFYDDATGERVELSVTTYANWVAKVASLLVESTSSSAVRRCASTCRRTGSARCS
jgi:uncharacterized protein (TIGR03089 family)